MGMKLVGIGSRAGYWDNHVRNRGDQMMHFLSRRTAGQLHAESKTDTLGVTGATWTFVALLLLLAAQLVSPSRVLGDSTGENSPTVTTGGFTHGAYAFACNESPTVLTATGTNNNQVQTYSVYGLSLPNSVPTPVVTGIQVRVRANDGSANNRKLRVSLSWDGGNTYTSGAGIGVLQTRNFRKNGPLKDYILGGPSVLWGRTAWSASDLSNTNFRVQVLARMPGPPGSGDNINLDCIPVTVFYMIPGLPDLSVSKTASPDPVGPTGNLTYTIAYSNAGGSTATNAIVSDLVPANTTYVSANPAPTSAPPVGGTGTVTWNVGSLPVGGSGVVTLVVEVNASVGTVILNDRYSIASDQNAPTFGNLVSTTVANAVLELSKSASPDPVAPGGTLTYTLTLHNAGMLAAANVVVNEGYDGNAFYSSQSTSPAGCASFGGAPDYDQWAIASFAAGATCTITVATTVASPLEDGVLLLNTADAGDDAGDAASAGAFSVVNQCAGQQEGSPCDDGDACSASDTCSGGVCTGTPYSCAPPDQCHQPGTCNGDGTCSYLNQPDATPCNDTNPCTSGDACSSGVCAGTPYSCAPPDQCHQLGTCNGDGTCSYLNQPNGTGCDDGNACTTGDTCQGGSCAGTQIPNSTGNTCTDLNPCTINDQCDGAGHCVGTPNTGAACDDNDPCTSGDVCTAAGSCAGTLDPTADPQCLAITEDALDHFLCYSVTVTRKTPKLLPFLGVNLLDQFGLSVMDVKKPIRLCAPANKNNEDPAAPGDPDHLMGYKIVRPKNQPKFVKQPNRQVVDQFGTIAVDVKLADDLLVPSAKSLSASPPPPTSPAVDHFECHKVSKARGAAKFVPQLGVSLEDQFGQLTLDVKTPTRLCAPVDQNGGEPGAETHLPHLMCYAVRVSKGTAKFVKRTPVYVNNEDFGPLTIDVKKPMELCLPALKNP